jgi:hypothetical protein
MVGTPPATVRGSTIRGCNVVGARGELAIDACDPEVPGAILLDGAYALIDNTADSFPSRPYISDFRSQGRTQQYNADGRANLLPRDCLCSADGTPSISGSGTITQEYYNLDGLPATISSFQITSVTGVATCAIPTTMNIATDDNVWVLLEVERTDGNANDDAVVRVRLGSTIVRSYSLEQGRQWIVIAVKATAPEATPSLTFGVSGTPAATVTVRCFRCFVYINPSTVDMPSMKVCQSSASKTFTSWAGTNLDAYNLKLCVLNAGVARNLDAILGSTDQAVGTQSVGAGTITVRDAGTSGVSAADGGIKLPGGGTATLTNATFCRHSDGYWYRV